MDPISDVLRLARFTGAVFLEARFTAPWAVITREIPRADAGQPETKHLFYYHLITQGTCVAVLPGEEPVWLEAGDLIFTGTPKGVGQVRAGDLLEAFIDSKKLLSVSVK